MLPSAIPEELVHSFKFYCKGEIYEGMRWGGELYICSRRFNAAYKLHVDEYAGRLHQNGLGVVVTKSDSSWIVWVGLRSLNSLSLHNPVRDEFSYFCLLYTSPSPRD